MYNPFNKRKPRQAVKSAQCSLGKRFEIGEVFFNRTASIAQAAHQLSEKQANPSPVILVAAKSVTNTVHCPGNADEVYAIKKLRRRIGRAHV